MSDLVGYLRDVQSGLAFTLVVSQEQSSSKSPTLRSRPFRNAQDVFRHSESSSSTSISIQLKLQTLIDLFGIQVTDAASKVADVAKKATK